jgi:tripartite ATP-independent transporter DctP family solute receptor
MSGGRGWSRLLAAGLALAVAGCAEETTGGSGGAATTIKLGTVLAADEPVPQYAKRLAENVKQRTDGKLKIEVVAGSALGSDQEVFEQALSGAPVIAPVGGGYLQEYAADAGVLDGPYIADSTEQFQRILKSPFFDEVTSALLRKHVKFLTNSWYFGTRHFLSDKAIRSPEDMRGLKMRVPPVPMTRRTVEAMGANATELEFSEVFSALESGVIDGAEAPLSTLYGAKLQEQAKVLSKTGHFVQFIGFAMGTKFFDTLASDQQKILLEEFERVGAQETEAALREERRYEQLLRKEGVRIVDDVDREAFKKATRKVYGSFKEFSPGVYDRVRAIAEGQDGAK